jgi:hypothetical protein
MPVLDANGILRFHSGVPYPEQPADQITPGLWLGGHYCQQGTRVCRPGSRYDLIVSLHQSRRYDDYLPTNGARVIDYRIADAELQPRDHLGLEQLALKVAGAHVAGDRVLVRCRAGLNRSGLVLGIALRQLGWSADDAIDTMRARRSPHVLHNPTFEQHVRDY